MLLLGDAGTAKSHNVLTLPGKTLAIYADNNRMTVKKLKRMPQHDITEARFDVKNWSEFDPELLDKMKNRELDFDNIVIDSIDMLQGVLCDKIRGNKSKLDWDDWGNVLNTFRRITFEFTQACRPQEGKRDYNVIATSHFQPQNGPDGNLHCYEPKIQGGFRRDIAAYFDLVLLADVEVKYVQVPDEPQKVRQNNYFIRTVSPDNYHKLKTGGKHWPARVADLGAIQKLIDDDLNTNK